MFQSNLNDSQFIRTHQRLAWLDYAKGLGIILVVIGHANQAIGRTHGLVWNDAMRALDAAIYSFHMPLFFLLAGFAASLGRGHDLQRFARSTFTGVLAPYLIWSVTWITLKVSLPGAINHAVGWDAITRILTEPVEHMWFLYHLLLVRVFWFAAGRHASVSLQTGFMTVAVIGSIVMRQAPERYAIIAFFLENLICYGAGMRFLPWLLGSAPVVNASQKLVAPLAVAWIFAVTLQTTTGSSFGILPAALLGSALIVTVARSLPAPTTPTLRILRALGEASLAIYLMHLVFMAGARALLAQTGGLDEWTLFLGGIVVGLALPVVTLQLLQAAATASGTDLTSWLGLGTGPSGRGRTPQGL